MFPDGRRRFSGSTWHCPWCGTPFKDGDVCPNDRDHWAAFTAAIRSAEAPQPVGARRHGGRVAISV